MLKASVHMRCSENTGEAGKLLSPYVFGKQISLLLKRNYILIYFSMKFLEVQMHMHINTQEI